MRMPLWALPHSSLCSEREVPIEGRLGDQHRSVEAVAVTDDHVFDVGLVRDLEDVSAGVEHDHLVLAGGELLGFLEQLPERSILIYFEVDADGLLGDVRYLCGHQNSLLE